MRSATLIIALALVVSGCANRAIPQDSSDAILQQDDMRIYVERVFRFQNRVMDELIASTVASAAMPNELMIAEAQLMESCRYLNESAAAFARGEEPELSVKLKVIDTVEDCDQTAREVWLLLGQKWTGGPHI